MEGIENMKYEVNLPDLGHFFMTVLYVSDAQETISGKDNVHIHDSIEFYILEKGDVSFFVGGNVYNLTPGDVILSKPNETHYCIKNTNSVHDYFCLWFSPACKVLLSDFLNHPDGEGNLIRLTDEDKKQLLSLCRKTYEQSQAGKSVNACSSAVAILSMFREVVHLFPESQSIPDKLNEIIQTIESKMETIVSIKDLCDELFISQSTMLRLFRRYLGVSPHEYLEARRLAMARQLLKEGKNVTDTASLTGFTNTSVFIRLFHRRFGITPLKFKQSNTPDHD